MTCIGKLTNACGDANIGVGEGMLVSEAIQDVFGANSVVRAEQASRCRPLDKTSCSRGSNAPPAAGSGLMDNPYPQPNKVDLQKVYAYQFMRRSLEHYHATRRQNERRHLQTQIEQLAVEEQFVTIFTSLVVVQGQVRKKRGIEKRQEIAALMSEYKNQVAQLQENETSRVRRELTGATPSSFNTVLFLMVLAMAFAALPMRRIRRRLC